jgi:hypothetical protein
MGARHDAIVRRISVEYIVPAKFARIAVLRVNGPGGRAAAGA